MFVLRSVVPEYSDNAGARYPQPHIRQIGPEPLLPTRDTRRFSNNIWNKIYNKRVLQSIEFPKNVYRGEDMIFNYKAFVNAKKLVYIDIPKYHHLLRHDSIMYSHIYVEKADDFNQFIESLELISKNFPSLSNLAQKRSADFFILVYRSLKYHKGRHKKYKEFRPLHEYQEKEPSKKS